MAWPTSQPIVEIKFSQCSSTGPEGALGASPRIYKGVQLYLTKNVCHVEACSATSGALRVRTKTGKRLYFTPWTDVERGNVAFYPIRLGSTVQKILGDKVERMVGRTKLAGRGLHGAEPCRAIQRILLSGQAHTSPLRASCAEVGPWAKIASEQKTLLSLGLLKAFLKPPCHKPCLQDWPQNLVLRQVIWKLKGQPLRVEPRLQIP